MIYAKRDVLIEKTRSLHSVRKQVALYMPIAGLDIRVNAKGVIPRE